MQPSKYFTTISVIIHSYTLLGVVSIDEVVDRPPLFSAFEGNRSTGSGGGLQVNGDATIDGSVFTDGVAQYGGAVAVGTVATAPPPGKASIAALPASVQITNTL